MHNTYFTIPGTSELCQTHRGTRPGDPAADVLFSLCMSLVMRAFHNAMTELVDVPWLGHACPVQDFSAATPMPSEGYIDVTFVDDCAVLMHAKCNEKLLSVVRAVVQAFTQAASKRGLEVNFDRGKTELMWNIYCRQGCTCHEGKGSMLPTVGSTRAPTSLFMFATSTNTLALRFRVNIVMPGTLQCAEQQLNNSGGNWHARFAPRKQFPCRRRLRFFRAWSFPK